MRVPGIGALVRSTRTGDIFTVKMTKDDRVLLQSLDGAVTVLSPEGKSGSGTVLCGAKRSKKMR